VSSVIENNEDKPFKQRYKVYLLDLILSFSLILFSLFFIRLSIKIFVFWYCDIRCYFSVTTIHILYR